MTTHPSQQAPLTREAADSLAAELAGEMIGRLREGERPLPEDFLAQHPELWEHPEAAADLIYEELCLRQEYGPEVPLEEVLDRFPQWRPQLEVLFDCQRLLGPPRAAPQFPMAGETLGDFRLLAELGGGAQGSVFLASQHSLGDRPVVLKVTPGEAHEHLSLARLQHTHIVPLYSVQDHPARGLRALCMPYFGGATLAHLLETLASQPPAQRTGQSLLDSLAQKQFAFCNLHFAICNFPTPAQRFLAQASYVQAVCWIGACLADALQYAHERGLVHLDLKPSNVLLAADGQPMVLDFHLAREPIRPEDDGPQWLGGTAGYMSPEQRAALVAVQQGRKVPLAVDGRSDIYSLGVLLYEALGGSLPLPARLPGVTTTLQRGKVAPAGTLAVPAGKPRSLHHDNPHVSLGLADVIGKCLAGHPEDRYPDMAALAADLRRHLTDRPLVGVRNRSLAERWRKWRRRRPHGVALAGMMLAVLVAASAVALGGASYYTARIDQARTALGDGQVQMAKGDWDGAIGTLERGLAVVRGTPWQRDLAAELERQLRLAEEGRTAANRATVAAELHRLSDRVRFLYGADQISPEGLRRLEGSCRGFWEQRGRIMQRLSPAGDGARDSVVRDDLLDLAIIWADLQVRLAAPPDKENARQQAQAVLAEAEDLFGPSPVLDAERTLHGAAGRSPGKRPAPGDSAWEHYALSRALLRSGDVERAAEEAARAVRLQPQGLWPNFYQGLCAYRRGRFEEAVTAYSVCIGAAPAAAGCFYNRAVAFEALGRVEAALHDYDQSLRLDPTLVVAALNRGMLHYRAKRYDAALADLQRAEELGADPSAVSFDRALVRLARGQTRAALDDLRHAFAEPKH